MAADSPKAAPAGGALSRLCEALRAPVQRRRAFVVLLSFALSFVPMVGSLGYFGALTLAPIFSWLGVFVGVDHARDAGAPKNSAVQLIGAAARELCILWALAAAVLALGALWNTNCDLWGGLQFFAMGPLASGLLGASCGLIAVQFISPGTNGSRPRRRSLALALLPFFACFCVGLWRLYVDPVVFAFDPFWGHFAGPIYDEAVRLSSRDLHFRAYNFAVAGAALLTWSALRPVDTLSPGHPNSLRNRAWQQRKPLGAALALSVMAGWYGLRPSAHGFHHTKTSIEEVLRGRAESEHFVIHYLPRSLASQEIDDIVREHEHAWRQLEAKIKRAPPHKLHSFIFDNEKQKRALFGAGNVEVSMPYRGHIYLTYRPFPHNVLHHELAHSFAGEYGDAILGLSRRGLFLNVGLIEGVANALAPRPSDELDLHDQAAILDALDKRPPLPAIMGLGFWGQSASRAYTAAGSFCLWLLQTRGADKLMRLYQNAGEFQETYGESLLSLEAQWVEFLRTRPPSEASVEKQRLRFERRSVFRRPCAHRAAELKRQAARARVAGDDAKAIEHLRDLCRIEAEEPAHVLALARALAADEQADPAAQELKRVGEFEGLTDTDLARIEELEGDIAMVAGAWSVAQAAYTKALSHALRESSMRGVQLKRYGASLGAAGHLRPAVQIRRYFSPFDVTTPSWAARLRGLAAAQALAREPGQGPVGNYLAARQLLNAALVPQAHEHIERSMLGSDAHPAMSPELLRAQGYMLVQLRLRTGDVSGAQAGLKNLEARNKAQGDHAGHALRVAQWRARIEDYAAMQASSK